jgi:DNA-binding NarL/FixJ family response regulator
MGAVKMMEALSPHLSANLRRTVDEVVVSALDGDHEAAMIIVDERARVVYSNPVGESFIRSLGTEAGGGGRARSTEVFSLAVADGETTVQTAEGACVLESRRLSSGRSEALRVIQIRRAPDFDSQYAEKLRSRFRFSEREIEVLAAVIQGQRNKEIAKRLCVSEHTVKKHIQNMARKANVASRTALVHAALQQLHLLP